MGQIPMAKIYAKIVLIWWKKSTNFLRYLTEVFYQMLLQTDVIRMSTPFQAIGEQTLRCLYCIRSPHPFCHTNISIKIFVLCCRTDTHLIINNFNTLLTICEEHRNNKNNNKNSDWTMAAAAATIVMIRDYCLKTACETWNFSFGAAFSLYFWALTRYYYNM